MPGVTKEQIARAKEWDLLSYLQAREPQELKRCGAGEFCLRSHGSLKISNGKWHWHSRGSADVPPSIIWSKCRGWTLCLL